MMNKKERAKLVSRILDEHFPSPPIPLKHDSPYTLLVAVLLSAQCTDERVNKITPILFGKAKTPSEMIQLTINQIQTIIRPCGLSQQKAKAIWELSKILVDKHGGNVPSTFEELEELPGIGHKSASVIMAQVFHKAAFPVDTHILRCANRWGLSAGKTPKQVEKDLKVVFPKKDWIKLHLQIIYFAREFCQARSHNTDECPICKKLTADIHK